MLDNLDLLLEFWSNYIYDQGYIHHFVFGIGLGIPLLFTYLWRIRKQKQFLFVMCVLAVLIELVQLFMPERTCDPWDMFSTWFGTLLVYWAGHERCALKKRRKSDMKNGYRFTFALVLLLIPMFSYAAEVAKEPTNYLGIRFGITKEDFLKEFGPAEEWKKGENPFRDVETLETELKEVKGAIAVDFYNGRTFGVCSTFLNVKEETAKILLFNLMDKYGRPDKIEADPVRKTIHTQWVWETVAAILSFSPDKEAAFFVITDREVSTKVVTEDRVKEEKEKKQGKTPPLRRKDIPKGTKTEI